jgi:organic hydroperoxide reductase OsmC/OhrA
MITWGQDAFIEAHVYLFNMTSNHYNIGLTWTNDLIFKFDLGALKNVPELFLDETNEDPATKVGVSSSRLLGMAVMGCLSSSFLFCMSKREFIPDEFHADVEVVKGRNGEGRLRVQEIKVNLYPKFSDPEAKNQLEECRKIFENFCTVTASIREGIQVTVNIIEDDASREISLD